MDDSNATNVGQNTRDVPLWSWNLLWISVVIVVGVMGISTAYYFWVGLPAADELAAHLQLHSQDLWSSSGPPTSAVRKRLSELNCEILQAASYHLLVVQKLMGYQYLALLAGLIAGALSAIFAFLVGVDGWKAANPRLRTAFLTSAGLLTFWIAVSTTFKYDENISKNGALYQQYAVLLGQLRTGVVLPPTGGVSIGTGAGSGVKGSANPPSSSEKKEDQLKNLLTSIEADLAKLRSIGLAFGSINTLVLAIPTATSKQ